MEELRDRDELVVELAAQFRSFLARSELGIFYIMRREDSNN